MAEDDSARSTLHHLNNLFQVIMGSLELLKRQREVSLETVDTALRATREASLLAQRLLASWKPPGEQAPRARPGETVLLVEDDGDLRRWAASALETLGYRVLQATDAPAALELLDSPAARRIDLLFSDVVLSAGMRPGVPALFTAQPYDFERLAVTVRAAIDSRRPGGSASASAAASGIGLPKK